MKASSSGLCGTVAPVDPDGAGRKAMLDAVREANGRRALHPDESGDEMIARAHSYRHWLNRIVHAKSLVSLDALTVDLARALWAMTGTPEPSPRIEGDAPEARVGRVRYVSLRNYAGNDALAGSEAGYSRAYIAGLVGKARNPSDTFLIHLARAAGVGTEWMLTGTGNMERVEDAKEREMQSA